MRMPRGWFWGKLPRRNGRGGRKRASGVSRKYAATPRAASVWRRLWCSLGRLEWFLPGRGQRRVLQGGRSSRRRWRLCRRASFGWARKTARAMPMSARAIRSRSRSRLQWGRYAVTFDEWDAAVVAGGVNARAIGSRLGTRTPKVIDVSWDDAQAYIKWLSHQDGPALPAAQRGRMGILLPGGDGDLFRGATRFPRNLRITMEITPLEKARRANAVR